MENLREDVCEAAHVLIIAALYGDTIRFQWDTFDPSFGIFTPPFILLAGLKLNIDRRDDGEWCTVRVIDDKYLLAINRSKTIETIIN